MSSLYYEFPDGSIVAHEYISFIESRVNSFYDDVAYIVFYISGCSESKGVEFNGDDAKELAESELIKFKKWYKGEKEAQR